MHDVELLHQNLGLAVYNSSAAGGSADGAGHACPKLNLLLRMNNNSEGSFCCNMKNTDLGVGSIDYGSAAVQGEGADVALQPAASQRRGRAGGGGACRTAMDVPDGSSAACRHCAKIFVTGFRLR